MAWQSSDRRFNPSTDCWVCGDKDHVSFVCPYKSKTLWNKCFKCGKSDHQSRECTEMFPISLCLRCGEEGHRVRNCPMPMMSVKENNGSYMNNGRAYKRSKAPKTKQAQFEWLSDAENETIIEPSPPSTAPIECNDANDLSISFSINCATTQQTKQRIEPEPMEQPQSTVMTSNPINSTLTDSLAATLRAMHIQTISLPTIDTITSPQSTIPIHNSYSMNPNTSSPVSPPMNHSVSPIIKSCAPRPKKAQKPKTYVVCISVLLLIHWIG